MTAALHVVGLTQHAGLTFSPFLTCNPQCYLTFPADVELVQKALLLLKG